MPKLKAIEEIEFWCSLNRGCFSLPQLLEVVNEVFELKEDEIRVPSREHRVRDARICFIWYSRLLTDDKLESIADLINRTHTLVIRQIRNANNWLQSGDEKLSKQIISIHSKLNLLYERL